MSSSAQAPAAAPTCPHCGGGQVYGHGSFPLKDGTRQKRFVCRPCGRTFHQLTGTPLNYLKKRDRWPLFLDGIIEGWTVRHAAVLLDVHMSTAFRWRHRLLSSISRQPQPVLTNIVAASEAFIPYSEKGSRKTAGPGARGAREARQAEGKKSFRRFIDGKPSCVLLASDGKQHAAATVSRGRPAAEQLCQVLKPVLGAVTELVAEGLAPYAEACRHLGVPLQNPRVAPPSIERTIPLREARRLNGTLHPWLRGFRGVATRYLEHYLAWYRLVRIPAVKSSKGVLSMLVTESQTPGRTAVQTA